MILKQIKIRDVINRSCLLVGLPFISMAALANVPSSPNNGKIPISDVLNPSPGLAKFQQQLVGQVLDAKGQPLSGVEVRNLKNATVTVTDQEGRFKLTGSVSDQIQFRLIGFNTKVVSGKDVQALVLDASENALDEVVVVGYGKQKKGNLTGAVASVNFDQSTSSRGLSNASQALQGVIPGLAVSQNSGMAGNNAADLLIRGLGTVNSAGPLIVVDGMPDVNMNRVNVNDIESVTVLKDASSAAVYGSRAANGVVLITTKSGKRNSRTAISFSANKSLVKPTRSFDFVNNYAKAMTATQRAQAYNTAASAFNFKNGTIDEWLALSMIDPRLYPSTDWWDVILRNGQSGNYNVSINGGTENNNYYLSVGMLDEKGIQINNDFKRYNAAFNFETKVTNTIGAGVRFSGNWSDYRYNYEDGMTANSTSGMDLFTSPAGILPYDPITGFYGGAMSYNESPQANNIYADYMTRNQNHMNQRQALVNGYLNWKPFKGFEAKVDYALNYDTRFQWKADMPTKLYNIRTGLSIRDLVPTNDGIYNTDRNNYKTQLNFKLSYDHKFGANHDFSALAVYSEEYWNNRVLAGSRLDRLHPSLHEIDGASEDVQNVSGSSSAEGLRSYIGRLNYTAFGKYMFEGNFRVDGSSRFLPGDQYGFFPSAAVGWRISDEAFMSAFKEKISLSSAKFRASYGSLGNNSGVGLYEQKQSLVSSPYYLIDNSTGTGSVVKGLINKKLINYDLTWEKTRVFNLGLDLGFFKNKLTAELDYYERKTIGMNRPSDVSMHLTGLFAAPRRNIGDMMNKGLEANVTWNDRKGDVGYMLNFNVGYNKNKLLSWNEQLQRGSVFIDMPYNFIYAFESLGIAQSWQDVYNAVPQGASPGDILLKDVNGDGKLDANDRVAYPAYQLGRPKVNYGFRGSVDYKGFDFSFLLQAATGRKEFWMNKANSNFLGTANQAITEDQWNNMWSLDNRDADYPKLLPSTLGSTSPNAYLSTFWLQNMSYLRVKNLQLGYTFKKELLMKLGIQKLRVFGSVDNLAVLTSFKGLDPEKSTYTNDAYPMTKSFVVGLNVDL
ncbi:TonB-linked SusC/RagA family outer membrane protein [Sphingobacterium zeae]|uniref:TonB-linked SusC/RagA family outer membrane protein n=1 Tax=Sphingobacterium zeae TaxID=1776859 RepID=A0ABU0U9C4_9SPHI|nr:TonB-dependent receptor [Sphingobacterium zeae]MDQ1151449.1 TonB-linked SusC/RagA family outer membrane protein [Sphingobacterium zeae]